VTNETEYESDYSDDSLIFWLGDKGNKFFSIPHIYNQSEIDYY
jgi:hypothetical protein